MLRALAIALAVAGPASAQGAGPSSPILTIDQERLFAETRFGESARAEVERRSGELAAENRRIEAELMEEERALTALRATLDPAAFRQRADAFDQKVQRLRAEQDEKAREVTGLRDMQRAAFFGRIGPILAEVVETRGAVAILDRRAILVSVPGIDITDEAIRRIDAALGDEGEARPPAASPVEPSAPPPQAAPSTR